MMDFAYIILAKLSCVTKIISMIEVQCNSIFSVLLQSSFKYVLLESSFKYVLFETTTFFHI